MNKIKLLKFVSFILLVVLLGSILVTSISCDESPSSYIGNKNTKVFHIPSCSYLPTSENRVYFYTREEAINAGYTPCSHCNP